MSAGHWVCGKKVGHSLAVALVRLYVLGSTSDWAEFAMVGRYNAMRHLKGRQWIHDVNRAARRAYVDELLKLERDMRGSWPPPGDPPYTKHPPEWRLTEEGERFAKALRDVGVKGWET